MVRQELSDLGPQRRIQALVGGIAILRLAPDGHGTIHTQGGQHKLLEVRSFILAIAVGHLKREVLCLGKLRVTPDTARGRIKVNLRERL
jgi:hypothetical protein